MVEDNDHKKKSSQLNSYARFSGLVIQMAAIIGVGTFIGFKLDEKFPNEYNLWTLILSLSAVIASIYYVIRQIISASKDEK